jgi:hypothetical protein
MPTIAGTYYDVAVVKYFFTAARYFRIKVYPHCPNLLDGIFAELTSGTFRGNPRTDTYVNIIATHSKGNDVLAQCLPGFTLETFWESVGCPVGVGLVFGEWTDFNVSIRVRLEKMPQE